MDRLCPSAVVGFDEHYHPVIIEKYAHKSSKELLSLPDDEFMICASTRKDVQTLYLNDLSISKNKRLYKVISLVDVENMDRGHLSKSFINRFKMFNKYFSEIYPETTQRMIIINAPFIFTALWSVIKIFINPVTARKVSIVGKDHSEVLKNINFINGFCLKNKKIYGNILTWEQEYNKLRNSVWYISECEEIMSSKC